MSMSVSTSTDAGRINVARDVVPPQRAAAPADANEGKGAPAQQMSNEAAKQLVADIQEKLDSMNVSVTFSTYGKNDSIAVTVIEKNTGDVIREIPPKELQQLAEKLDEMIGLIFSKSA